MRCENCEYYEEFTGVCFNGYSPYKADFIEPDKWCPEWVPGRKADVEEEEKCSK